MKTVIGIDIGTSGTKTILMDEKGSILASSTVEYPMAQPQNGWAEQDPADWWMAVKATCKNVITESGIDPATIAGVGLSGQMHSLVMLDENNEVIRPSILWCDQRTEKECEKINELVGKERLLEITANPALTGFTASKILWVRNNEPENYAKCRHILLAKDYIRFKLTGEYATEVSDASGMQLLDVKNRCWSDEVLEKLSIDKNLLGKMYESPEVTGTVTEEASRETLLPTTAVVVGGAGDNAASAIGTGIVRDGTSFMTIGTSGVLFAHTDEMLLDPKGRVHTMCCAVPGAWHIMGVTLSAGLSLQWLRNNLCSKEIMDAEKDGIDPYILMDKEAEAVAPGADGLLWLPYLMAERTPHLDPNCRAALFGLSNMHTRPHIIRAVLEGVAYSMHDCLTVFNEMGANLKETAICGGGAKSPLWRKILCDVCGIPFYTVQKQEGGALGVAILALVGAKIFDSVQEACDAIIVKANSIEPDSEIHETYEDYYALYQQLYPALKDSYTKLSEIRR